MKVAIVRSHMQGECQSNTISTCLETAKSAAIRIKVENDLMDQRLNLKDARNYP